MLEPRKYILKNLEKIFYEVKDYIRKIPTEQMNRVALQSITLRIASVYTALSFRCFSQVHQDWILYFKPAHVRRVCHLLHTETLSPH